MPGAGEKMYDLVVEGGTFLPMTPSEGSYPVIEEGRLVVSQGKIVSLGGRNGQAPPAKKIISGENCVITPGFINGHTHNGMALFRGLADDVPFETWLKEIVFPIEQKWISKESVYLASLLGCVEMLRGGTTFFNDMYYFEEETARAAHEVGMRATLGVTFIQDHLEDGQGVREVMSALKEHVARYPGIQAALAPHSLYSLSPQRLVEIGQVASDLGLRINIHLSETVAEVEECLKKTGQTPVAYLETLGLWEVPVTAAHCVQVTKDDIRILAKHGVGVAHNPESNLKLGNHIAPLAEMREAGVKIAIGTDSVVSNNNLDLLQEAATASRLQSLKYGPGRVTAGDLLHHMTADASRAVGLENVAGQLAPGLSADFVVFDAKKAHLQPLYDPFSQLIYAASGSDVRDVAVHGVLRLENGKVLGIDEEALLKEVMAFGKKVKASLPSRSRFPRPQPVAHL